MISNELSCFYFYASLIGYFIGLAATFCALHLMQSSQPALLYILPAMLFTYLFAAFGKKEFVKMIKYDEDEELSR